MKIIDELYKLQDKKYAAFQSKLTPGVPPEKIIGVRIPEARKLAKELIKSNNYNDFLNSLPHGYYDENILHALIISEIKDYDKCIEETEKFLPYIDNWAVCDIMSPKVLGKSKEKLIKMIYRWTSSEKIYTCRFGLEMLMTHYLGEDFKPEYLKIATETKTDEYYLMMMVAWYFATALAKQWDSAIPYIEGKILDKQTHNKVIQKSIESYRITNEQKAYLKTLKIKGSAY